MADAHLGGQQRGAVQRVNGRGKALHTGARGILEKEGRLGRLAWWGGEGGSVSVSDTYRRGDVGRLMHRVCGRDKALCTGPGEILEEGGLWELARWGRGPGGITVPDAHWWGKLRGIMLGGLVLGIRCVWEEGEGVKLGMARW